MIPRQMIKKCLSLGLSRFMGEYVGYERLKFSLRGLCSFEKPIPQVLIFLLKQFLIQLLLIRSQCFKDLLRIGNQQQIQLQHATTAVPENFLLV